LEEVGEPVIFTRCDEHIPRAREWLQRLGFVEDGELWRKDFLWPH